MHPHSPVAWEWYRNFNGEAILFCRHTQIGLLRLLTTEAVMGSDSLKVGEAWSIYDRWFQEPRVEMAAERFGLDELFRKLTQPFSKSASPKVLADCYLLSLAAASDAALVTFDGALKALADRLKWRAILLS